MAIRTARREWSGSAERRASPHRVHLTGDRGPRVVIVCGALRPELDGVADGVLRLAGALRERGAIVRVLHAGPRSGARDSHSVGPAWSLRRVAGAARWLRGADVVHVQFAPSMYRFRAAIGLLPLVPRGPAGLVVTLHEYGWWQWSDHVPDPLWRLLERLRLLDRETALLVPRAALAIVTNPAHEADVARRFGGRVRTARIPIGANVGVAELDGAAVRVAVRAELGLSRAATLIAFFGFVHPVKGVRYLADAVGRLALEGRDVHLVIVGGFESMALPADEARAFEAELRGQIAEVGAADRTHITGFLPERSASRVLAACDLAVLPFTAGVTTKSGSLLTVLAHGLPTVVTAVPDSKPELAEVCVVVPEVRNAQALADGIRRVLDDADLAARSAREGRAFASGRDWSHIAERHLAVYRQVQP